MRVLHVIQELRTGGAERVLASLVEAGLERGDEVAVAAVPRGQLANELGVEVFVLPLVRRRPWNLARAAWSLQRATRGFEPELVHAHNPAMAAAAAFATGRGKRIPALVTIQGVPDEDYRATARTLRLAGLAVVACGPGVTSGLEEHGSEVEETIVNSIAPSPPPADRAALMREWQVRPNDRLVVAIGRLAEQKNHALAIRALAHVPEATLAVLGEGPLRGELEQTAADAGVSDRVVLPGVRRDARAVLAAADAAVLPSRWEGLPLAGLEALAAGTPLVATEVRGSRELLEHERTALLVPDGDERALADQLARVLEDATLRETLARNGRQLAGAYTEAAMVERYFALYDELVRR